MTESSYTLSGLRGMPWKPSYAPADDPLNSFYIPALERSVAYARIAGFFTSASLSVAAKGIASLVSRGGRMRLLVGAQLSEQDVDAILRGIELQDTLAQKFQGILTDPETLADHLVKRRLETLAWLAANDRLDIRVVVEADPQTGVPITSNGYFHAKSGILRDEYGDAIAFSGSINETATAWKNNYEKFSVYTSWEDGKYFEPEVENFERLWADAETGWRTVDLPTAVRDELITLAPSEPPPSSDPELDGDAVAADNASWIARFVRDAPHLVDNGLHVGVETAGVDPFPHQRAVAYDILDRFSCNHLLADEVGLGKTIEAGLILRSLLLSGRVRRCLILVPRSLAKQWQEELRDRFLLDVPFYDGRQYEWFGQSHNRFESIPQGEKPWEGRPVVIASAQMVKREDRARELLDSPPWDLIMVDEAHHARRREFATRRDRPNRLLGLLRRLADRSDALLLLTATPMQVDPVEVRDLLDLVGLPEAWRDAGSFVDYFVSARLPYEDVDWGVVQPMLRAHLERWGWGDAEQRLAGELRPVGVAKVKRALTTPSPHAMRTLNSDEHRSVMRLMRRCHPVVTCIHRHTRQLLREYHRQGLISQHIPVRRPQEVWLEMSDAEKELYSDVEEYISRYYNQYEEERPGLGFVMTIYRRRLTSGLYALGESLKRRRQFLLGESNPEHPQGLEDEDIEDEDLSFDVSETLDMLAAHRAEEVREIDRLIQMLDRMPSETKLEHVLRAINDELTRTTQVIVFTQYTDTMDNLRDHLRPTYGSELGCYSGRGGERWMPETQTWAGMSKDRLQREFSEGSIRVLVCTDAAAEGLNLQNCGSMFNYDMPWNPMKVEQRIGRIDRIGQRRREVRVKHFMYEGTVEADVYAALGDRIDWFETVVGDLQPILQAVQRTIRDAAMSVGAERREHLRRGIESLQRIDPDGGPMSDWEPSVSPPKVDAPFVLADLAELIREMEPWKMSIGPGSRDGTFRLANGDRDLTFDQSIAEDGDVNLCSYNVPEFDRLMALPSPRPRPDILRLERHGDRKVVGYYGWTDGRWELIRSLAKLRSLLDGSPPSEARDVGPAMRIFESALVPSS